MVELEARNGAEHWQAEQLEAATLNVPVSGEIIMHHDIVFLLSFYAGSVQVISPVRTHYY